MSWHCAKVLFRYLGEVSEDALRQNFSTVLLCCTALEYQQTISCHKKLEKPRYLLLDEMIDSGLPFTTELNSLEAVCKWVALFVLCLIPVSPSSPHLQP